MGERTVGRSDDTLVAELMTGNRGALEELFRRWNGRVYYVCLQALGSEHDAADASQETWVQLWRKAGMYTQGRSFKAWLLKVALNTARNFARTRRRVALVDFSEPVNEPVDARSVEAPSFAGARDFEKLIDRLEPRQKTALYFRFVMDLSYEEIAEATGLTVKHVSVLLCRARTELRRIHGAKS